MSMMKALYGMLPLKAKRRLNKKLVTIGVKSAPKPRGKVRNPRKQKAAAMTPVAVTVETSPVSNT